MKPRTPSLRLHPTGQYCCQWGGKVRYLGADPEAARSRYEAALVEWRQWVAAGAPRPRKPTRRAGGRPGTLARAVEEYLALKRVELVPCGFEFLREKLQMLVTHFGSSADLNVITEESIEKYKAALQRRYSPKTVKHGLTTAKQFAKWARKRRALAIDLTDWPTIRVPPPAPKAQTIEQVEAYLRAAESAPPRYAIYLRLAFLTGCRPAELVRMVRREGQLIEGGTVFVPATHKTARYQPRYIALGPTAQALLASAPVPQFKDYHGYLRRLHKVNIKGSHFLRHSAATALLRMGYSRSEVDEWIGHAVSQVSSAYMMLPDFSRFIEMSERLAQALNAVKTKARKAA